MQLHMQLQEYASAYILISNEPNLSKANLSVSPSIQSWLPKVYDQKHIGKTRFLSKREMIERNIMNTFSGKIYLVAP